MKQTQNRTKLKIKKKTSKKKNHREKLTILIILRGSRRTYLIEHKRTEQQNLLT